MSEGYRNSKITWKTPREGQKWALENEFEECGGGEREEEIEERNKNYRHLVRLNELRGGGERKSIETISKGMQDFSQIVKGFAYHFSRKRFHIFQSKRITRFNLNILVSNQNSKSLKMFSENGYHNNAHVMYVFTWPLKTKTKNNKKLEIPLVKLKIYLVFTDKSGI